MKAGKREFYGASLKLAHSTAVPGHIRGAILELSKLETLAHNRKQGYATALMHLVCKEADESGTVLILMPRPFGDAELGSTQLETWYERFGFFRIQDDPVLMARGPGGGFGRQNHQGREGVPSAVH